MMKRILAASAALVSVAAMASTASAAPITFTISGDVPATCNLGGVTAAAANTINLDASGTIIDSNGKLNAGPKTINVGANWCNGAGTTASVTLNPILGDHTTSAPGFTNRVDYQLSTAMLPGSIDSATTTTVSNIPVGAFTESSASFTITPDPQSTNLLVAGTYTGSVVITVTPAA